MQTVRDQINQQWKQFFFSEQDVGTLAIVRILVGVLCVFNSVGYISTFDFFYAEHSAWPRMFFEKQTSGGLLNVFAYLYELQIDTRFLGTLSLIFSVAFCLGLFTRTATIGCFVLVQAFALRNPYAVFGFDDLLRNILFILIFSGCGFKYSLDSWWAKKRGHPLPTTVQAWPMRLVQIQMSAVYVMAAVTKMLNPVWMDGTALYYISRMNELRRFSLPLVFDHLLAIKVVTWNVLLVEFALGTAVWIRRYRNQLVILGVVFHLGIDLFMNLPYFQYLMIAGLLCFWRGPSLSQADTNRPRK